LIHSNFDGQPVVSLTGAPWSLLYQSHEGGDGSGC